MTALRVALLDHGQSGSPAHDVAASLRERGHEAVVLGGRGTAFDALLDRRGFATPLAHVPATLGALARGRYDLVHAFSPQDAYAALLWRRRSRGAVVFSCTGPIERERFADGRLRLRFLSAALARSDAVIVHDEGVRAAAWRWFALELPLIEPADGAGHELLYRRLTGARA